MVCFEKAEDAKTLISKKTVEIKGIKVQAVRKMVRFISLSSPHRDVFFCLGVFDKI